MKNTSPTPLLWPGRVLILLFGLFLALPLLDMLFNLNPDTFLFENRPLAGPPEPPRHADEIGKYFSGIEAWFNDHFGWRTSLVRWHDNITVKLFKEGNHGVIVGNNGWIYYSDLQMVDHFRSDAQFTDAELRDWQTLLEHRRDWLARRGIKFLFVLAPDKHTIYPEYLPAWLKKTDRPTKADQLFAYMQDHSTVNMLDLRPVLLAAKKSAALYQQTDTHWNKLGSFVAYQAVVNDLTNIGFPQLKPLNLDSFHITHRVTGGCDLSMTLGVFMTDSNEFYFHPTPGLPPLETVYLSKILDIGATNCTRCATAQKTAMIYHDSFGEFWVQFLGYQFREADYTWQPQLDLAAIERKHPDIVIAEMLERFVNTRDPKKILSEDALP